MDISDPTQPNIDTQLSLPLGVPAGKKKKKIAAVKRVRSPVTDKASELILERILEHVKNVQNELKDPPRGLEELTALLAGTVVEDSPLADASVKVEPLTFGEGDSAGFDASPSEGTTDGETLRSIGSATGSAEDAPLGSIVDTPHPDSEAGTPPPALHSRAPTTGSEELSSASITPLPGQVLSETSGSLNVVTPKGLEPAQSDFSLTSVATAGDQSFAPEGEEARLKVVEGATVPQSPPGVLASADEIVTPSDGIEVLVRMAKQGELDPKAVDIVDVTDKFLKLIAAAPKENLRQSGKILFHACVLLRMKAEALLSFSTDDDDFAGGDDFLDFEDGDGSMDSSNTPRQITFADLEKAIVRRTQRRRVRPRPVTLDELIEALREAERIEKTRADKKPKAVIQLAGQHSVEGMEDLLDLAHDEDIETTIDKVEQLLAQILNFGENIELMALVKKLDSHEDWVDAFLASLFLSNAGKIDLQQSVFYGPLYIALCGGQPSVANA